MSLGMLLYVRKRLLQSGEGLDSGKAEKDKNSFHELEAAEWYRYDSPETEQQRAAFAIMRQEV